MGKVYVYVCVCMCRGKLVSKCQGRTRCESSQPAGGGGGGGGGGGATAGGKNGTFQWEK